MYKVNYQDICNFLQEYSTINPSNGRDVAAFVVKYSGSMNQLILFHKMCFGKVTVDKLEKYGSTDKHCICKYFEYVSIQQFGFPICKHTANIWLSENPEEPIGKYLKFLGEHFNEVGMYQESRKVIALLHTVFKLESTGVIRGFYHG